MYTVIFGCGNVGVRTLTYMGEDKVDFFADNNTNIAGEYFHNKKILSYDELLKLREKSEVIIILGVNKNNAEKIAVQLENDGVYDFVLSDLLPGFWEAGRRIKAEEFEKIQAFAGRQDYVIKYLRERLNSEKKRVDYFKRHASISHMSPAVGALRKKQLDIVQRSRRALDFLDENCKVSCWINAGTLIGKMRHNGFIPWDNDMDFGIMRSDWYRLIDFFKGYSTVCIPGKDSDGGCPAGCCYTSYEQAEEKYKGKYILEIWQDFIRICIRDNNETAIALELFPFDYYVNDLTIEEYHKYASEAFMMKRKLHTCREWFDYCCDKIKNGGFVSMTPTDKILPGIDTFTGNGLWNIEDFLAYDTVFPLKKIDFEGEEFLNVNNEEKYIVHEYPNWKSFPDDICVNEDEM